LAYEQLYRAEVVEFAADFLHGKIFSSKEVQQYTLWELSMQLLVWGTLSSGNFKGNIMFCWLTQGDCWAMPPVSYRDIGSSLKVRAKAGGWQNLGSC